MPLPEPVDIVSGVGDKRALNDERGSKRVSVTPANAHLHLFVHVSGDAEEGEEKPVFSRLKWAFSHSMLLSDITCGERWS